MLIRAKKGWQPETGLVVRLGTTSTHEFVEHIDEEYAVFEVPDSYVLNDTENLHIKVSGVDDNVSIARFTALLGFSKVAEIIGIAKQNDSLAAAQVMMDARVNEGVNLNSESMALYYALLKEVGIFNDSDIDRIKQNKTISELAAEQ